MAPFSVDAVALTDRTNTLWTGFYGYAEVAARTPITAGTLFETGSIGKTALGRELLAPTLAPELMAEATTVAFPGLTGVLPGFGRQEPNDWGLGFEIRDDKRPHWTGTRNSPGTFGHFGQSGSFLWVDPAVGLACACLTGRRFGDWAARCWPDLSDRVLAEYA